MPFSPFEEMQKAVDIVNGSPHPVNKIAATICGQDRQGRDFSISRTNHWPPVIEARLGTAQEIGNSSGTLHAETACILDAPCTEGASLFITDPFCPNCAKNIAEAGIEAVYLDHKGFGKDFAARRGEAFTNMSMEVCDRAGISVHKVWRKENRLETILSAKENYFPVQDSPIEIERLYGVVNRAFFALLIETAMKKHHGRRFAAAIARDRVSGNVYALTARTHAVAGFSMIHDAARIKDTSGKYNLTLEPLNRLMMGAARIGAKIIDGMVFCTNIPTAREQVNLVGAEIKKVYIQHINKARDAPAIEAKRLLTDAGILNFVDVNILSNPMYRGFQSQNVEQK